MKHCGNTDAWASDSLPLFGDAGRSTKGPASSLDLSALTYKTDMLYNRLERMNEKLDHIVAC